MHTEARVFVRSLATAPSCTRQAAFGLIESCSGLASKDTTSLYTELDEVKSLYSARLAICEMKDAGLPIPSQCTSEILRDSTTNRFIVKLESRQMITACVQALEARPQSWTSYSNNRQNALIICRASREEKEREERFETMRKFVETNEASQEALSNYVQFVRDMQAEQQQLASEIQASQKQQMDELLHEFASVAALVDQIRSSAVEASHEQSRGAEIILARVQQGAQGFAEVSLDPVSLTNVS